MSWSACSRNPQSLTDDDYDKLRRHGLTQSEIVEIVGMSALAVYANIIADATAMDPDEMFQLNLMTQPPGL